MIAQWAANLIRAAAFEAGIRNVVMLSGATGIPADSLRKKLNGRQRFYPAELQAIFRAVKIEDEKMVQIMKGGFG